MEDRIKQVYPYFITMMAVLILGFQLLFRDVDMPTLPVFLTLLVASTIAYAFDVRLPFAEVSQGFAVSFIAIVMLGPVEAALVAGLGMAICASVILGKSFRRVIVNASVQALSCFAAGALYYALGGFGGPNLKIGIDTFHANPIFETAKYSFPVISTGFVNSIINSSLLVPVFLLEKRIDLSSLVRLAFWDAVASIMFLPLVFIVFVVYGGDQLGNLIFTLCVLLAMWLVLKRVFEINISRQTLAINLSQLKTIHEISKAINTSLDIKAILEIIAINGTPFIGAEASTVRIFDDLPHRGAIYNLTPDLKWSEFMSSPSFNHIVEHLRKAPQKIIVPRLNISTIGRWFTPELAETHGVQSFVAAPVLDGMRCMGAIMFLSRKQHSFTPGQVEFMEFLANETAVALKNARLYQEMHLNHERQQEEIRIAERVQLGSLPRRFDAGDVVITGGIKPARELSGDFFDVIETKPDEVVVVIGDVSGKGIPASLTMMAILNSVKVLAPKVSSPAEMMTLLNASLFDETITMSDTLQYSTGFYAILDRKTFDMKYSIAGSERPLWWHARQKVLTFLEGEGIPLGMFGDFKYKNNKVKLEPDDRIILYTDGVTDAVNSDGERYSINRFLSVVEKHCLKFTDDIAAALFEEVGAWTAKEQLVDDVAIYVLHLGTPIAVENGAELIAEDKTGGPARTLFD